MITKNILLGAFLLCSPAWAFAQTGNAPQLGKAPIDNVLKAMTLQEKAYLLVGGHYELTEDGKIGKSTDLVPGAAGQTVAIPRLGIPATVETDGPAGVRIPATRKGDSKTYYCTGFPIGTLLASTWDKSVAHKVGVAMGNEVLEYNCDVLLAPGMNIHRNPLNGRNFEYFSEDPVLSGWMAASVVNGVQSQGVGTSIKHFVANNQETYRLQNSSNVSQRALREIYLKGFELAVKIGNPWTIMSSYNKLNGVYTQEDYALLYTVLRNEWGYQGVVMTDWTGYRDTAAQEHASTSMLMWGDPGQAKQIVDAVNSGKLSMADVDRNVKYMLRFIVKTPHFRQYVASNNPDLKAHAQVAREAATEGIILLKNDNATLPLTQKYQHVALFGVGAYHFLSNGTGSGDVNKPYVVNMQQGLENAGMALSDEIKSLYEASTKDEVGIGKSYALRRAADSDIAIITISRNAGEGADRHAGEGDFCLSKTERTMLENVTTAFHAVDKKVIVVLNVGGVVETASWKNLPDAIILAWQPGEEGGNAVTDILTGKVCPSGKLPMTFPINYMDIPSSKNFPSNFKHEPFDAQKKDIGYTNYEEGIWVGYRYFNTQSKAVSYPFGYGMSYTTFDYSSAKVKKSADKITVTVRISNTGRVAGKEAVQLYVSAPKGTLEKPLRELKAFAKTRLLQPGEFGVLNLSLDVADLASFDETSNSWIADAGTYKIQIGASVDDIRETIPLIIKKSFVKKVLTKL